MQEHLKPSITEKIQYKVIRLTRNPIRLKFMKKISMSNPVESLRYRSSATARVAQDLLIVQMIEKT